jgi:hypothetical protein
VTGAAEQRSITVGRTVLQILQEINRALGIARKASNTSHGGFSPAVS